MDKIWEIYILKDPNTNEIRYVGASMNLNHRRHHHYNPPKNKQSPRDKWARGLRLNNQKVIIDIIDSCEENLWQEKEKYWIKYHRELGCNLFNVALGGKGATGVSHTPEQDRKFSEKMKGRPKSENHIRKVAEKQRDKLKNDPEFFEKKSRIGRENLKKQPKDNLIKALRKGAITRNKRSKVNLCLYYKIRKLNLEKPQKAIAQELNISRQVINYCIRKYTR